MSTASYLIGDIMNAARSPALNREQGVTVVAGDSRARYGGLCRSGDPCSKTAASVPDTRARKGDPFPSAEAGTDPSKSSGRTGRDPFLR